MRLSERVGYALEHLIIFELERQGISFTRSEQVTNEAIKSDISIKVGRREIVLFVTHTRTQGMTNRKFYRTLEELGQRRLASPKALCVEISLVQGRAGVRKQQDLIFSSLFDATYTIIDKRFEGAFVSFVENVGNPLTLDNTRARYHEAPQEVIRSIKSLVANVATLKRADNPLVQSYWQHEQQVVPGSLQNSAATGVSIKLGMKMLTLLGSADFSLNDLAKGHCKTRTGLPEKSSKHLQRVGIASAINKTIGGVQIRFSEHVAAAAEFCLKAGLELSPGWYRPYLKTAGAERLRYDLMDIDVVAQRNASLNSLLLECETAEDFEVLLQDDYRSDEMRCDLLDLAIRGSGFSQNELSVAVLDLCNLSVHVSDSIVYLINKSEDVESILGDIDGYISCVSKVIWDKCSGDFSEVPVDDFYSERLKTYFSNAYVTPEHFLLDAAIDNSSSLKSSRSSVLPRVCGLEKKYRMSVVGAKHWLGRDGRKVFLITVSTPEKRHHKHKEFSGKLRAIRYDYDNSIGLKDAETDFVLVADGHWTGEQLSMLSTAGWNVFDWDSLLAWLSDRNS